MSRLGNPLVNEVLIPLGQKDYWNRQDPAHDNQFLNRYLSPELSGLVNLLYPALPTLPTTDSARPGRGAAHGRSVAELHRADPGGRAPAEHVDPADRGVPNSLGVLAGDFGGFPNGRRLSDDVIDIELRAVACGYGPILHAVLGLCDLQPNDQLGDGVDAERRVVPLDVPVRRRTASGLRLPHCDP